MPIQTINHGFLNNLQDKKVLLYVSSTAYNERYQELPFDYVILNRLDSQIRSMQLVDDKVILMPYDNNKALRLLKNAKVKIQCFVGIQDGCVDGGNYECVNSPQFFGRLSPILDDKVIYITNHWSISNGAYGNNVVNGNGFFNSHYRKVEIDDTFPQIAPEFRFCNNESDDKRKIFVAIKKRTNLPDLSFKLGNIEIKVSHASVWDYEDDFNCLIHSLLRSKNQYLAGVQRRHYADTTRYENNIQILLDDANTKKWEHIGTIPFMNNSYQEFIELCRNWQGEYPKSIHLCHLEDRDLAYLRKYATQLNNH